jgi:RimJ/RimL family protein N-acetyltransferase
VLIGDLYRVRAVFDQTAIPTIETERLILRGWRAADIEPLSAIYGDAEVAEWLGSPDPDLVDASIARWLEHWRAFGFGTWAVEEKSSGSLIGRVGLVNQLDWTASEQDAEVGWTLARSAWGNGYATEGAMAALGFARAKGLRRIISITRPDNVRSQTVMKRLGLTYRGATHWHGYDQVWYGIELEIGEVAR